MFLAGTGVHSSWDGVVIAASFLAGSALGVATTIATVVATPNAEPARKDAAMTTPSQELCTPVPARNMRAERPWSDPDANSAGSGTDYSASAACAAWPCA